MLKSPNNDNCFSVDCQEKTQEEKKENCISFAHIAKKAAIQPAPKEKKVPDFQRKEKIMSVQEARDLLDGRTKKIIPQRPKTSILIANWKAAPISKVKKAMKEVWNIKMNNIYNIDFIGRSVAEIQLFKDYIEEFKRIMTEIKPDLQFLSYNDPLNSDLFKKDESLRNNKDAARAYRLHCYN